VKFLFSLNVPSGANDLVHQVVGEAEGVNSMDEMHALMCELTFIKLRLMFYTRSPTGEKKWTDKGEMLLSTRHIAKVQIYTA
jgi:hypothetical protein